MEILVIKPDSPPDGGPENGASDQRWFPGMVVQAYEDGGIGTPVTSKRCFAIRVPGVTLAQARQYFRDNLLDIEEEILGPEYTDEFGGTVRDRLKRRAVRFIFSGLPQGVKDRYQAGERDFTFTKEQVLNHLQRIL